MARDPRADILEDDFFPKAAPRIHRVHAHRSNDGTIHVGVGEGQGGFFGVKPRQPIEHHKGKIWHFSKEEQRHLLLATGAFTLALGLMRVGGLFGTDQYDSGSAWAMTLLISMPVMLIAVGPAFLLHEIGHKVVAKHYGCWAEFRADPKGLQFGVALAAFLGVVFMAPGAVMVAGLVTRRQNGHIAIAGPLVNLGLFVIGIPLGGILLGLSGIGTEIAGEYLTSSGLNLKLVLYDIVQWWIGANLILATFNMLPFGPLDGAKIRDWNYGIWFGFFIFFLALSFLMISGTWNAISLSLVIAGMF